MKERVTISVDPEALEVARAEVRSGTASSVSEAVERALLASSKRLALREALDLAEAEHGPISEEAKEWATRELRRVARETSSSTPGR